MRCAMREFAVFGWMSAMVLCAPGVAGAESKNPADYPLRVHIFRRSETTFYTHHVADEAKGEGRANLFEGGEPKGMDFQYDCDQKLQTSSGYETFPAKWKKTNQELVVLQPEFGRPNAYTTCKFKVMVKDFAYMTRNGSLATEPTAEFKQWMVRHAYDPEHGKTTPTPTKEAAGASAPTPASVGAAASTPAPSDAGAATTPQR